MGRFPVKSLGPRIPHVYNSEFIHQTLVSRCTHHDDCRPFLLALFIPVGHLSLTSKMDPATLVPQMAKETITITVHNHAVSFISAFLFHLGSRPTQHQATPRRVMSARPCVASRRSLGARLSPLLPPPPPPAAAALPRWRLLRASTSVLGARCRAGRARSSGCRARW